MVDEVIISGAGERICPAEPGPASPETDDLRFMPPSGPWSRWSESNRRPTVYPEVLKILPVEPERGFEPPTCCLQNSCSTPELLRQDFERTSRIPSAVENFMFRRDKTAALPLSYAGPGWCGIKHLLPSPHHTSLRALVRGTTGLHRQNFLRTAEDPAITIFVIMNHHTLP